MRALTSLATLGLLAAAALAEAPQPPMPQRRHTTSMVHGTRLGDEYRWLEKIGDPQVRKHLQRENAYAAAQLAAIEPKRKQLVEELTALTEVEYDDPPERYRGFCYAKHYDPKLDHPVLFRQRDCQGPREVLLDLNQIKTKSGFVALGDWDVSPDEQRFAYSLDTDGRERNTLFVRELATGKAIGKPILDVADFSFAANDVLFYVALDRTTQRPARLYRRNLAQPKSADVLVYEERDPTFSLDLDSTRSDDWIVLTSGSHDHNEVRILSRSKPFEPARLVNRREQRCYVHVENRGDTLYIMTDAEAPNYRLVKAPVATPTVEHWQPVVAHDPNALIENLIVLEHFTALEIVKPGQPQILVLDEQDHPLRTVAFDQQVYDLNLSRNLDYHRTTIRYSFETPVEPARVDEIEPISGETQSIWRAPVPGYDAQRYAVEWMWVPSHDGQRVPVTLYYRKDRHTDEPQPLILRGYGAYGESYGYGFSSWLVPLLNRGVVVARAHVRGGSELGRKWHEAGRRRHKANSFLDLIAVEEALISRGYTSAQQLILAGGSAGGLLVAATINLRPDLCRAAMLDVPFVDVVGSMLNPKLPLSVEERLEWGDPTKRDDYLYMRAYSPYQNLRPQPYPTVMLRTSVNDSRVMYWEPVKYAARLRVVSTSSNPVLLRVELDGAGHLGRSGRKASIAETAEELAYYMWIFDTPPPPTTASPTTE